MGATSPMMFAFAWGRTGLPVPARRLALLVLVSIVVGTALVLASGGRASAQQAKRNVEVDGTAALKWEPANVTVPVGGSVTFKISGGAPHPVGSGTPPAGDSAFDTSACGLDKMSKVGDSCTVTFKKAGSFPFFCGVHFALGMTGTITVGSRGGATTATAEGNAAPVVSAPSAAPPTPPSKPAVYWLGYGLLAGGALLALATVVGYLRFAPGFRRRR
jgi:plastocyanin